SLLFLIGERLIPQCCANQTAVAASVSNIILEYHIGQGNGEGGIGRFQLLFLAGRRIWLIFFKWTDESAFFKKIN
ncbi:hypothetical protein ACJX0J_023560, partial [Zea mays]